MVKYSVTLADNRRLYIVMNINKDLCFPLHIKAVTEVNALLNYSERVWTAENYQNCFVYEYITFMWKNFNRTYNFFSNTNFSLILFQQLSPNYRKYIYWRSAWPPGIKRHSYYRKHNACIKFEHIVLMEPSENFWFMLKDWIINHCICVHWFIL